MASTNDAFLQEALRNFEDPTSAKHLPIRDILLLHRYCLISDWLEQAQTLTLNAVFLLSKPPGEKQTRILVFVSDKDTDLKLNAKPGPQNIVENAAETFHALAAKLACPVFDLKQAIRLEAVHIPKPWGQEIWLSGMEERGVSRVSSNVPATGDNLDSSTSISTPLPWLLSIAPDFIHGLTDLALLKILDPASDSVKGDLYFELHKHKHEVYVVTQVNTQAWPDGTGGIRLGMNQTLRKSFPNDTSFRNSYLEAVSTYQRIREAIDSHADTHLHDEECKARAHMETYTAVCPLKAGDTVVIEPNTPHSLLHGVRVIEFQSPVYERYIISFAQKVLTQSHWDSDAAIQKMSLSAPEVPAFDIVIDNQGVQIERIASFAEFNVWRIELQAQCTTHLTPALAYAICIGISGRIDIGDTAILHEQACLLTRHACNRLIENKTETKASCLIAAPGL